MPLSYSLALLLGDENADEENRIVRLLRAWIGTMQPIEDTLQSILAQKDVDAAEGAQLDLLGRLVGQDRAGLADVDYRRYIRARIATNRSNGTSEDLIRIVRLLLGFDTLIGVETVPIATVIVSLFEVATTDALALIIFKFLMQGKAAGIQLELLYTDDPDHLFIFDTVGHGWDDGHLAASLP